MNSTNTLRHIPADAPAIIRELRNAFDERMLEFNAVALEKAANSRLHQGHDNSEMIHIDLPHGPLQLTAIYHAAEDRFTQLIARMADEAHHERPSFTISLFL